ncbi:MAG: hypothetical protein HQL06_14980 [Nitrospirae bacterium]|nr:hypothetical protein [Nitrospirota bacterium]
MDTPIGIYDKIIKELMEGIERPLIEKVLGIKADKVSRLNVVTQLTDEREADFVLKVENDGDAPYIIHAEVQSTNDTKMVNRMLRYFVHIYTLHELVVKQYVIYIGKDRMTMKSTLDMSDIHYRYKLIDMRDVACEQFLYSGVPDEIILSMLCNSGGRDERTFAREILSEYVKSVVEGLDLSKGIRQLEVFSKLRDMQKIIIEEVGQMPIVYDLETDIRFMQGVEKGLEKGILKGREEGWKSGKVEGITEGMHKTIEVLLKAKFGADSLNLMPKIRIHEDESRLNAITEALINAEDIKAFEELL